MRNRGLQQKGLRDEGFQRKFSGDKRKVSGVETEAKVPAGLEVFGGSGASMEDGRLLGPAPQDQE